MYAADEYVMLSALQHFAFCSRQCALIHIEQAWAENIYTLRGLRVHEKVHQVDDEIIEAGIRVERSLYLSSQQYGIRGIADVVKFDRDNHPYPVEYKSGSKKSRTADSIQLCAQALCLEEMFNRSVEQGAIFYHKSRRRKEIDFTSNLRSLTIETIRETRSLLNQTRLPPPVNDKRCDDCSLLQACMPETIGNFTQSAAKNNPFKLSQP